MAYKFVDTTEKPGDEEMPAEAMKLNGEYIENQMDARYCTYRTLYVKGREMLSPELTSYTTGVRDGSSLQSKKFPARVITVGYKLQATSNYWFRIAYNELNKILNVKNAEIIFYDEQDKYFTGTPQNLGDVDPGTNFVQGEFTILCNDPFKYSIVEYEIEPTEDDGTTFVVDYNGTYKGYPILEADFYKENSCGEDGNTPTELTGSGECGYVAWFKPGEEDGESAKIIQLGDPEEEDIETYDKSQTLMTQSWTGVSSWTTSLNALWAKNSGHFSAGIVAQVGSSGFKTCNGKYILCATDYGSNNTGEHGPSVTYTIPADATGDVGATDWTLKYDLQCCLTNDSSASSCMGGFQVHVCDDTGYLLVGMSVYKEWSGNTGEMRAYINNGGAAKTISIDLSYNNSKFGAQSSSTKSCTITKTGSTVTMNLAGTSWSFTNTTIQNKKAAQVSFVFTRLKDKTALGWSGIYSCSFTKNNCETWADIPNKFQANDVAVADCRDGQVYMNNSPSPEYGALGNNWEEFCLTPGYNQIGFSYSDWCETPPTTSMRYREVYL